MQHPSTTIPSLAANQRFEGITQAAPQPDGTIAILFVTDFSNAACRREAYDIKTRQRCRVPCGMQFFPTMAEAQALGWDRR
jgi:hypothetical protein